MARFTLGESPASARSARNGKAIAFVLPDLLPLGGAERAVLALGGELSAAGYPVHLVLGTEERDAARVVPAGVSVVSLKRGSLRACLLPFIAYLRRERPATVVASMWPFTSLCVIGCLLAGTRAQRVVVEQNTLSMQFASRNLVYRLALRAALAVTYRLAHVCIAVSKGVAADVAALSGLPIDRFAVQYNPLSIEPGSGGASQVAEEAWQGWTGKRILTVGRLKAQKNHELLILAFEELVRVGDAKLMIVGTGPLADRTAALIRAHDLGDRVLLPGHFDDVAPFYRAADLFVLSSDYEGCPNVLIEALAFGLPVVSTDCPSGPAEVLEDGRFGTLVPVRDVKALAAAMGDALGRDHDREGSLRRAEAFSPRAAAQALMESLASRGSPGPV